MTDGSTLTVSPIHLPLHGENVYADHYIHLSDLAALIFDHNILARVERNPSLRAAVLSNPFLAEEISHNTALLNLLARNPALLGSVINDSRLLRIIKENPATLEEILRNPSQSIEIVLQNSLERNKLNQPEENIKNIAEKKSTQFKTLNQAEKSPILKPKINLVTKETIAKVNPRKIPINIFNIQTPGSNVQAKIPLIQKQNAGIYIDPKTLAMHPSLLILLAATAFSASRTKVTGNPEELETQTERQLDTLQEIDPIHEVEEASEVHLMKETIA